MPLAPLLPSSDAPHRGRASRSRPPPPSIPEPPKAPTTHYMAAVYVASDIVACKLAGEPLDALLVVEREAISKRWLSAEDRLKVGTTAYRQMLHRPIESATFSPTGRFLLTMRTGDHPGGALYQAITRGMIRDSLPAEPLLLADVSISDCGQRLFASTQEHRHHIFERSNYVWSKRMLLPDRPFAVSGSAFSPDGDALYVAHSDHCIALLRRSVADEQWQQTAVFQPGFDPAWLCSPSRLFLREPASAVPDVPGAAGVLRRFVGSVRTLGDEAGTPPTATQILRNDHFTDTLSVVCKTGEGLARVLTLHHGKWNGSSYLLKLTGAAAARGPKLFDVTQSVGRNSQALHIDWPAPGRWLAAWCQGGEAVDLIDLGDNEKKDNL